MKPSSFLSAGTALAAIVLLSAEPAAATQAHGAPEGLYVHQFSHLFFIFAMAILIYWLRSRGLVQERGWRSIQYAALFFILWSMDAFFVHILDEQLMLIEVRRTSAWHLRLQTPEGFEWLAYVYYILKLDHLLCVPGLFFLGLGLFRLASQDESPENREDAAS